MSQVRGFDPSKVQRKHVFPKTLVYGNDIPGVRMRMERFAEVLRESGDNPAVYRTASDAIGYISAGDMFSDSVCIVVMDASDAMKSSTESKRLLTELTRALSTYDNTSTIAIGLPMEKSTESMKKFIKSIEDMGGVARSVIAPNNTTVMQWLDEYVKSINMPMSNIDKRKLVAIAGNDIDTIRAIISAIGPEIPNLSEDEIREWMDKEESYTGSDIRHVVASGKLDELERLRKTFGADASSYRTFLLKLRANVLDLLIASESAGDVSALVSLKAAQYGNGNSAYYIMRETNGNDVKRYEKIYTELNRQLSALSMSGDARYEDLVLAIVGK